MEEFHFRSELHTQDCGVLFRVSTRRAAQFSAAQCCAVLLSRRSSSLVDPAWIFSDVIDHVPIALLPLATRTQRRTDTEGQRRRERR